jgi:HEAT repeat protein
MGILWHRKMACAVLLLSCACGQAVGDGPKRQEGLAGAALSARLESLRRDLKHPDKQIRKQALNALAELGPQARPLLAEVCEAVHDEDQGGQAYAIHSLSAVGTPAIPLLIRILGSDANTMPR